MVQNDKKFCLSCPISHEPYIICLSFMVCMCKMMIYPGIFFIFSKFWFSGLKRVKMVQNNRKVSPLCSISQEPYIIWLSFMMHMCKMIISPGVFFFYLLQFWFSRSSGGWKCKTWPKITKNFVCCTLYFRNHISYDLHLWYTYIYKRIISPVIFFHFF